VDVLVSFAPNSKWSLWDIIAMKEELEILFGREDRSGTKGLFTQSLPAL
jgi:predicted nucleotidyltransferase